MALLTRGQKVGAYEVQSLIKENLYTQTYRVEDEDANPYFLKLFIARRMPAKLLDETSGRVLEIEHSRRLAHKNIVSYVDSGTLDSAEGECPYYVTNYFSGELLAERLQREGCLPQAEALSIYRSVLEGLQAMHAQSLYHNDVTPRNIMLNAAAQGTPEIIDLGHVSGRCNGRVPFDTSDLEEFYCANETFAGIYDQQSDIFAATALLYTMLTGAVPWAMPFEAGMKRARRAMLLKEKRKAEPIDFAALQADPRTQAILAKGMALDYNERYGNVGQVLADLTSDRVPKAPEPPGSGPSRQGTAAPGEDRPGRDNPNHVDFEVRRGGGNGFADIAGMASLKDYLRQRVIFVIQNKEKVERYRLTVPNGMLLYGPPGCGKTFVAEKFAEETGFNFILVKSSDLASSYVHGSQEKIAQLFRQAEANAPIVLCFDEFDALVPDRSIHATQYVSGEVNEFLSQLNNCSRKQIFVIGTTNRPDKIDPAVLRTGRMDKQVYVPLPDHDARREMFLIHLKGRPYDARDINADLLADLSEGFIASDIAYVVNDAAMVAAFTDQDITQALLETSVRNTHPSLRPDSLKVYDDIRQKMECTERNNLNRRRIGFV